MAESLNDDIGNGGIFNAGQFTPGGVTPSDDLALYRVSPGKAYIKGYEIVNKETKYLEINKARESLSSDNVNLKSKGLPTYSITNVYGSVPLNKEGSELTAYPDVFLYSTFNDGSIGLNDTELSTDHRQTIDRRGKIFNTDDGIKTITLQITNTVTLIGSVTDATFQTQFGELFYIKTRSDLGTPTAISSFKTLSFATTNKPLINSSESVQFLELTVYGNKSELELLTLEYDLSDSEYKRKIFLSEADAAANNNEFGFVVDYSDIITPVIGKTKPFVDYQNDATAKDIKLALREGFRSIEHVKRYTTTGMGTDQGKISSINALGIVSDLLDKKVNEVGTTIYRPPYAPLSFSAIAGRNCYEFYDPERKSPIHNWHLNNGAIFEDVGQWKRPYYFPQNKEDIHQAVKRECLAVRNSLGILDASTLGKIDLQGPDAAKFLNMIYTNAWSKLEIGSCRYGLMCNEHGMIFDDGVTSRLGENHYHMTTTTGGAARVMSWLEEFLQTEWLDMKVFLHLSY